MNNRSYKRRLFNSTFRFVIRQYFLSGIKSCIRSPIKLALMLLFSSVFLFTWVKRDSYIKPGTFFPGLNELSFVLFSILIIAAFIIAAIILMILFGMPKNARKFHDNFQRAGMINSSMEAPALMSRSFDPSNHKIQRLEFFTKGLPLSLWQDNKEKIESAQNISIDRIERGKNNQTVIVYAVDGKYQLPDMIRWSPEKLSDKSFVVVLGESIADRVEVDLSKIPHLLIGGSTGSGKTLLIKSILAQCIMKGAVVYIADFKGGVDFNKSWKSRSYIITEHEELSKYLNYLVDELNRRKLLLVEHDCTNVDEYNLKFNKKLPKIVFAVDEAAELLDKTGLDKIQKERISRYEAALSTLIRLGRAFSIHVVLGTQRPDANVISGQIKNNIDFRACGRADNVLSQIILDKTDANDLIPKNARGRFLTNTDVLFQAYYFDDRKDW